MDTVITPDIESIERATVAAVAPERLDEQQLPLTLVNANSLLPCEEKGCSDLRDPLSLVRLEVGDAQWTPERAKELIKQAWPDRAQDAGDDE